MARDKVFISYSHANTQYREELCLALRAVLSIDKVLWFDERGIDIGARFHPEIQQALAQSRVGILLLSNHFFTSNYIKQHELPYLVQQAEQGVIKLGCLYVTSIPDDAFKVTIEVNGQPHTVNLKDRIGAHRPNAPLNTVDQGQRDAIYASLANWVTQQLTVTTEPALPRRLGQRFELAIALGARRDHWAHSFSLPQAPNFARPVLDCPRPEVLFGYPGYTIDGEDLFQLLFGSDVARSGAILGAAFGEPTADPTRHPLRVRLLTDDDRLCAMPWGKIAYQGRRLAAGGWTVELHPASATGLPEYPLHTCYFPGKVVLVSASDGAQTPQATAHFHDLHLFFQRRWQQAPEPTLVSTAAGLRAALRTGSTRLVYYYGAASPEGLLLEGLESSFSWTELAGLLQRSRSVSAVFLNLLGEGGFNAIPQGRLLLDGAVAVLWQCNERTAASAAAKAALDWLHSVFAASERLDPVVALHQHQRGQVAAWTRYSHWQTVAPQRIDMPDLVNLLLDRRSQRAELSQAKDEFYTFKTRRIYHAVALGTAGCRVAEFPAMASQHLRNTKREQEVFIHRSFSITAKLDNVSHADDLVRQHLGITLRQSVIGTLLTPDMLRGNDFWFLVLGWVLQQPLADAAAGAKLIHTIADWCRMRLFQEMLASTQDANVRALSIVAIEASSLEVAADLEDSIANLTEHLNDEEGCHVGELERLAGVRRQDLSNYFRDRQLCSCDDRYRDEFPQLLLCSRREMPFDQAVVTIRRGDPDNWGNLYEELRDMTASGDWPPADWPPADDEPTFWESRDGR